MAASFITLLYTLLHTGSNKDTISYPHSFSELGSNPRPLIYDAFFRSPMDLVFVSTYYHDQNRNFTEMQVVVNGINVTGRFLERKDWPPRFPYEPIRIVIYSLSQPVSEKNNVHVTLDGQSKTFHNLEIIKPIVKDQLAVATLIEGPSDTLPLFFKHYRRQGVTRFEMYINANYTGKSGLSDLPTGPDIRYHEWNYDYWTIFKNKEGKEDRMHHAQVPLINMLGVRVLPTVEWLLLCDIDELAYVNHTDSTPRTILWELQTSPITPFRRLGVFFAKSQSPSHYKSLLEDSQSLKKANSLILKVQKKPSTSKIVYHRSYHDLMNVHHPNKDYKNEVDQIMKLAHMIELTHPNRLGEVKNWTDYVDIFHR